MFRKTAIFSLIVLTLSLFSSQAQVQIVNAKAIDKVANDFTVEINSVSISTDGRVMHYSGTAEPGAYVQVNLENNRTGEVINLGETRADEKGNWEFSYQNIQPLSAGMHTAQATSSSSASSRTAQSQPVVFKVFYFTILVVALILTLLLRFVLPKLITKMSPSSKEESPPPRFMYVKPRGPPFAFFACSASFPPFNLIYKKKHQNVIEKTIQATPTFLLVGLLFLPNLQEKLPLDKTIYSSRLNYNTCLNFQFGRINKFKKLYLLEEVSFKLEKYFTSNISGSEIRQLVILSKRKLSNQSKIASSQKDSRLFLAISLLEKPRDFIQLLHDLFSPEELENLCKRFEIVELLAKGASYNEIEKKVGVSVGTIAKASSRFNKDYGGYKIQIERVAGNNSKEKNSGGTV